MYENYGRSSFCFCVIFYFHFYSGFLFFLCAVILSCSVCIISQVVQICFESVYDVVYPIFMLNFSAKDSRFHSLMLLFFGCMRLMLRGAIVKWLRLGLSIRRADVRVSP